MLAYPSTLCSWAGVRAARRGLTLTRALASDVETVFARDEGADRRELGISTWMKVLFTMDRASLSDWHCLEWMWKCFFWHSCEQYCASPHSRHAYRGFWAKQLSQTGGHKTGYVTFCLTCSRLASDETVATTESSKSIDTMTCHGFSTTSALLTAASTISKCSGLTKIFAPDGSSGLRPQLRIACR